MKLKSFKLTFLAFLDLFIQSKYNFDIKKGRFPKSYGPGYVELYKDVDIIKQTVDIREKCALLSLPSVSTKDQIELQVTGLCFYRIIDPMCGVMEISSDGTDVFLKILATKLLREVIEEHTLDDITTKKNELQKKMAVCTYKFSIITYINGSKLVLSILFC